MLFLVTMCYVLIGLFNYISYRYHNPYDKERTTIVGVFLRTLLFTFFVFGWGTIMWARGGRRIIYLAYVSNNEYLGIE